jgi:hypothetical protein
MKPLTLKEIKKRHVKNPQDKELHKTIEIKTVSKKTLNKLIEKSTKQKPFDKKD